MEVCIKNVIKWKPLLLCHLAILFLVGTFLWPATRPFWNVFDTGVFKVLNHTLEGHPWAQTFWAIVNHKNMDWAEDVVFLLFFIFAVKAAPKPERQRRIAQFIFCLAVAGALIYCFNRILFREVTHIHRKSPSLVVTPCVRVSDRITWLEVKDRTHGSFPGDHATTLIYFTVLYIFFAGRRLGFYAVLYSIFRILPRLILGAHWMSDILVGSCCLVLLFLSWALCTPFHLWLTDRIEKLLTLGRKNEIQKELV